MNKRTFVRSRGSRIVDHAGAGHPAAGASARLWSLTGHRRGRAFSVNRP